MESLKKVDGKRVDDARHHALDALVVAAIGEWEVNRLTRSYQQWEQQGLPRPLRQVDPPWGDFHSFRREVCDAYERIFVARPERRRARGEGHAATIRQVRERDGKTVVFERVAIMQLGMDKGKFSSQKAFAQLSKVKDPDRNSAVVGAIKTWIDAGRPQQAPPLSPAGHPIRKIRLVSKDKPAVIIRGGTAGRGDFVRIDVYTMPNNKGIDEYFLVPIYPHEINRPSAPQAYMSTGGVELPISSHQFKMSIYNRSYVEIEKRNGSTVGGYVVSFDRSVAAIRLAHDATMTLVEKSSGVKTLKRFSKYSVDRFGRRAEVKSEVRTWHGEVCTSPTPPG